MSSSLVEVKVNKSLGRIEDNLEAVKASVQQYVADYKDYVVSEDTVKDSKNLIAEIRKQKKLLDDERKQIKKEWNSPFDEFEKRAKEVISLYDEPINLINGQLEKFEQDRKAKKRLEIRKAYDEALEHTDMYGDLDEYLPFEKIFNPKWENAIVTLKSIKEEIQTQLDGIGMQISTIKSMESEFEDKGLEEFKRSLDFQKAIQTMQRYQKQKEEILARQEAERKAAEERVRAEAERKEAEERARAEAERKEAEERARAEAERKAMEEADQIEEEKKSEDEAKEAEVAPFPDIPSMEEESFVTEDAPFETSETVWNVCIKVPDSKLFELKNLLTCNCYEFEVEEYV